VTIAFEQLSRTPRLLLSARLEPVQGQRFQPTGFPDLGAATYRAPVEPNGVRDMLLVESAQSMANRLEAVTWDAAANDLAAPLKGLPYVVVVSEDGKPLTNSVLEAHRLNSPYILESGDRSFFERLKTELNAVSDGAVDLAQAARTVFKYDCGSVLHGVFLAKSELAGGRIRLTRLLSAFIEAEDAMPAESGGVKNDRLDPAGDTKSGFGNVPFHRVEYVARKITAYFNLDLALLRSYGMGEAAEKLLIGLALWKIRHFLESSLRLRTACDLVCKEIAVDRPQGFELPSAAALDSLLPELIAACRAQFAQPPVTRVTWRKPEAKGKRNRGAEAAEDDADEADEQ